MKIKTIIFAICVSILTFCPCIAYASPAEITAEREAIALEIEQIQKNLDVLSNEYNTALINKQQLEESLEQTAQNIEDTNKKIQNHQETLKLQCIDLYKIDDFSFLNVILNTKSFNDFINNFNFYHRFIDQSEKLIQETSALKQQLQEQQTQMQEEKINLENEIIKINQSKELADEQIQLLQTKYDELGEELNVLLSEQYTTEINGQLINFSNLTEEQQVFIENYVQQQVSSFGGSVSSADYNDIVSRAYSMIGASYA